MNIDHTGMYSKINFTTILSERVYYFQRRYLLIFCRNNNSETIKFGNNQFYLKTCICIFYTKNFVLSLCYLASWFLSHGHLKLRDIDCDVPCTIIRIGWKTIMKKKKSSIVIRIGY